MKETEIDTEIRTKAIKEFKASLSDDLIQRILEHYSKDLGRIAKPSFRRAFSFVAPKAYARAVKEVEGIVPEGIVERRKGLFVDHMFQYALDFIEEKTCPGCNLQFIGVDYCSKSCGHLAGTWGKEGRRSRVVKSISRHSAPHPMNSKKVYAKVVKAKERHTPEKKAKSVELRRQTCLDRFGVDVASKSEEAKRAKEATCIREYGAPYLLQLPKYQFMVDRGCKMYDVPLKDGSTIRVQGKSERALVTNLNEAGYLIDEVRSSIRYRFRDKSCVYFPDFLVLQPDTGDMELVEVKSPYTLQLHWERNCAKFLVTNAWCIEHGMTYVLCVVKPNGSFYKVTWPTRSKTIKYLPSNQGKKSS